MLTFDKRREEIEEMDTIDLRVQRQELRQSQHRAESIKDYSFLKKPTTMYEIMQYSH